MTREIEAVDAEQLVASSLREDGAMLDDLAETVEGPSAPRILIMDAAEMLIAHAGFGGVTEETISKAANVSLDLFQAHFADKLALLRALNDRFCAHAVAATDEATRSGIWDHTAPSDVIEIAVRSIFDVVLSRAELVKAVLSSGDPQLLEGFRRVGANITAQVARVIDEMQHGGDRPHEQDLAFSLLLAVSLAHHSILLGADWSGTDLGREGIHERAIGAVRAYLDSRARPS